MEDDEGIRVGLQELLESEGHLVRAVQNGREALELFEHSGWPGLVLLDLFMPVMNGLEFLQEMQLRHGERLATLPVVLLSAAPPQSEIVTSAQRFARAFLKKPVDIEVILEVASRYCGGGAA